MERTSSVASEPLHAVGYTTTKSQNIGNGELEIFSNRQMHGPCLVIKEPAEENNESSEDKTANLAAILDHYSRIWLERTKYHLGYPINSDFNYCDLDQLQQFSMNYFGDPFIKSNYGVNSREFELGVLDWFAQLWGIDKGEFWGYITNGGTEGNLHGILVGREMLPDGILYTSEESHYSIFKAERMYRINCIKIEILTSGEINTEDLKIKLLQNKNKPAIININIGTTMKGAIDDLDHVLQTLDNCGFSHNRFYIHCDAALFGIMLPFVGRAPQVTFKKPIGSISVSGHKFLGCPMPCGVQIVRKQHITTLSINVEYICSIDATITGSRNGHAPIFLWYTLSLKGRCGIKKEVQKCLGVAQYLKDRLRAARISTMLNEYSNIVVFERPMETEFIRKWQLASQGNISHVCVMPHVTKDMLDTFVDELVEKYSNWVKDEGNQPFCIASEIGKENCLCHQHMQ